MEKTRTINLRFDKDGDRNNEGYLFDFNSLSDYFGMITDIENLGISFNTSFNNIGNRFVLSNIEHEQKSLKFKINFKSYEKYKKFIYFCRWSKYNITVNYGIPIENEIKNFRRDYILKSIEKSEKTAGILICQVELKPITFWYSFVQSNNLTLKANQWVNFSVDGETDLDSEIYFLIGGTFKNLYFELVGNDFKTKKMYLKHDVNGNQISYSSIDGNNHIKELIYTGYFKTGEVDLMNLNNLDFENENIFKIPAGCNATLRFKTDEVPGTEPSIYIEIRKYLISV